MPRRWHQVGGSDSAGDGGKKARSPGRARRKPLKPLRREAGVFLVEPVVLPPCFFCTGPTGATGTRLSLRPLIEEGGTCRPNLARNRQRDREAVCCLKLESAHHGLSSPRSRGPITTGRGCLRGSRRTAFFATRGTAYGSPRSRGRHLMENLGVWDGALRAALPTS
jgi:hypothetical protein